MYPNPSPLLAVGQGASGPPARYWRLRFPSGPSQVGITEIEMMASDGGADLTSSVGAAASSTDASFTASRAFDDNVADGGGWFSSAGAGSGSWISCDLGSATDLEKITVRSYSTTGYAPSEIVVEYSHDNSAWYQDTRWPTLAGLSWDAREILQVRRTVTPLIKRKAGLTDLANDSGAWTNFTLRQTVAASVVPGQGGTRVRFSLRAGNGEGLAIGKCYVGVKGAGAYEFASTPVQVQFSGSNSTTIPSATTVFCDDVSLTVGPSDALVISVFVAAASSANDTFRRVLPPAGVTAGYKSGDDAATVTPSGYTSQDNLYLDDLEVWTP